MGILSSLFGKKADLGEMISAGATLIDVRTKAEYQQGHIKGSVNIPLDVLEKSLAKLNTDKPYITCCASGMRSGVAKGILKKRGFVQVENGGSWLSLRKYYK